MRRSQGRRKSQFPAKQDIPSDTTFDFVVEGANWKIPKADFLTGLGVTGTLEQTGASTGVPVLDQQGSANLIRNLEMGATSGLTGSLSAENGITLALDAQVPGGTGVPVLDTNNKIRNIKAGSSIAVAGAGDDIVISYSAVPGASSVVVVNSLADFPTPSSGVIPLAASTVYFIQTIVDVGVNTFSLAEGTVLTGLSFVVTGITSSGTGILFENAAAYTNEISRLRITAPSCTILGVTAGAFGANVLMSQVSIISCVTVLNAKDCDFIRMDGVVAAACSADAFVFDGIISIANFTNISVFDWVGTLFALGTATFVRLTIDTGLAISNYGTNVVIEGQASSGNIFLGSIGTVTGLDVTDTVTASANILSTDLRWDFQANNWIANSIVNALLSLQANATATTISVQSTPVLVAGTWTVEDENRFTGTAAGRLTYKADRDITVTVLASLTASPVSGVNRVIGVYVAVNGTFIANSKRTATVSASGAASITVPWSVSLEKNDYVEMFVANDSGTENIVATSATFLIS